MDEAIRPGREPSPTGALALHSPAPGVPMRVVFFASGGGGNFRAVMELSEARPDLVHVGLLVVDRRDLPVAAIAEEKRVPVLVRDFEATCGRWSRARREPSAAAAYRRASEAFHDEIATEIERTEERAGAAFDLAVLAYRRWIHGRLLRRFADRMINQHPGDLCVRDAMGRRTLVGLDPVFAALGAGADRTRTSTFLVTEGHDTGEILCQGPWVEAAGARDRAAARIHEMRQKEASDWPSIRFAVREIALGNFAVCREERRATGERIVVHRGVRLSYGGVDLCADAAPHARGAV